ncbi:uncharacterized protein K441DRAFT_214887 [Cenococcum geophilum 1.58]|uniref:uncharacterized protein n=1 Tax=Cenococcum geophilum 1.58 TaxID=794803 RepID=UPI00358FA636|nr:hypothetical protein K441DRAFT_214887 [Cenococcum geophilum 1.58]
MRQSAVIWQKTFLYCNLRPKCHGRSYRPCEDRLLVSRRLLYSFSNATWLYTTCARPTSCLFLLSTGSALLTLFQLSTTLWLTTCFCCLHLHHVFIVSFSS